MSVHHLHDRNFLLEPLNVFHLALLPKGCAVGANLAISHNSFRCLNSLVVHCEIQHAAIEWSWKTSHCESTKQQTEPGTGNWLTTLRSVSSNNLSFCFQCFMMFSQWFHEVFFLLLDSSWYFLEQQTYAGLLLATLPAASQQCRPSQWFSPLGLHLWPCSCLCKRSHRTWVKHSQTAFSERHRPGAYSRNFTHLKQLGALQTAEESDSDKTASIWVRHPSPSFFLSRS